MKRRILAIFCVLATLLGMAVVPAYAAEDRAADAVTVLTQDVENLVVSGDTYIDLNGFDIAGVTVEDGTLYVSDSKTDDYTVADGIYGSVTGITGDVQAAEGYLAITEGEALSYHKVDLTLKSMTLRPAEAGVYYNSAFAADEVVAAQVDTYGVALSVVGEPTAKNLTTQCGYSAFEGFTSGEKSGTLLSGVMKKDNIDYINNRNANMAIYGRAYICVDGDYIFGACAKRSLKEQVEAIDAVFASLNATQQSAIADMYKTFKSVMSGWNLPNISEASVGVLAGDVEITIPITAEDGKVTEEITVEQDGLTITIPFGALVESDELTLTVTREEQTDVEAAEGQSLLPLNVHVDGLSAENTVPLTIGLGKVLPKNLNLGNYAAYHTEDSSANEMTLVSNDEPFTAHNQFKYDLEGRVTLHVAGFSLFTLRSNNANTWNGERDYEWYNTADTILYIRNADQLAGLGAIVGGMDGQNEDDFAGKTVKLLADISIGDLDSENDYIFYPIGYYNNTGSYTKISGNPNGVAVVSGYKTFRGTFDGNGNTISDFYQNTWEMFGDYNDGYSGTPNHSRDGMGLFGRVYGGTVKNLTVKNFSCDSEFGTTGVIAAYADNAAAFENIAIFGCNPRVYNNGNGGIVGCVGWYAKDQVENPVTFTNITVDQTNKISALWGTYDAACGGILGQYYPTSGQDSTIANGGVRFENCHVAAEMDVNNDVCGNYQYYWYRYCGMFLGSVRENTTENGYTVARKDGITAENCTYNVGKWNNYYYCELVANTVASYTHDHQMSRLTPVKSVVGTTITPLEGEAYTVPASGRYNYVVVNGEHGTENATCYHFVDGQVWEHEEAGTETVNGVEVLKEDNQHIYLPFNQLFTGYGWGIKAYQEYPGMAPSADTLAVSTEKFTAKIPQNINIAENVTSIAVSDLFEAGSNVIPSTTHVYISPVGEDSTVEADYVCVTDGYLENIADLPISGTGKAKITITDYYFCTPTVLYVTVGGETVANVGDYEFVSLQDAMDAVKDGGTVTLLDNVNLTEYLDIHTANFGETARNITLDLAGHTIAPAADYKYEWYPLVFVGINQTLNIKGGTIQSDEHTAIGVYGALTLENVTVANSVDSDEDAVCIWNWSENDEYFQDCQYLLTGSATITGGNITGSILAEGTVAFNETAQFDKLYLNTKTGHGKYILPTGYGMVNNGGYYTMHKHEFVDGTCTVCGLSYSYVLTDIADIDSADTVVITMTDGTTTWAIINEKNTTTGPSAVPVTVDGDKIAYNNEANDILWNINNVNGELTIYPNGNNTMYLYCTNTNNGVRVGTGEAKHFVIENGYLKNIETNEARYLGVYNAQDWRCYDNTGNKIAGQEVKFYVLKSNCAHENAEDRDAVVSTCTVTGREAGQYCLDCNTYVSGGKLVNATGHKFEFSSAKEETCVVKNTYHCEVCNKIKTETIKNHTWNEGVIDVAPTCVEEGTKLYTCTVCSETKTEDVDATGHAWDEGKMDPAPTCNDAGVKVYTCTNDNCTETKTEAISAKGHTAGESVIENEVEKTCTTDGSYDTVVYCTVCEAELSRVTTTVKATGHMEVIDAAVAATCTATGLTEGKHCDVCKEVLVEQTVVPKLSHTYNENNQCECGATCSWEQVTKIEQLTDGAQIIIVAGSNNALGTTIATKIKPVTVTVNGNTIKHADNLPIWEIKVLDGGYALNNGTSYLKYASSTDLGSSASEYKWTVRKNGEGFTFTSGTNGRGLLFRFGTYNQFGGYATSNASNKEYTFDMKVYIKVEVEPACDHRGYDTYYGDETPATCTVPGKEASVYCSNCDGVVIGGAEIPVLPHTETTVMGTPATCTEAGIKDAVKCSVCNTVISGGEEIPATGHSYVDGKCACGATQEVTKNFVKVTSTNDLEDGATYLIVYEGGSVAFNGGLTTLDATKNTVAVTIANGEIAYTDELSAATFTIDQSGSDYTIKSASGYYIGQTSNANGLKANKTTTYANGISINADGTVNFTSGGAYLRFNSASDQMRFRYYKSGSYTSQKAITLYKLVEG